MEHASFLQAAIALLTSNNNNNNNNNSNRNNSSSNRNSSSIRRSRQRSRRRPLPICAKDRQISAASAIDPEKEKETAAEEEEAEEEEEEEAEEEEEEEEGHEQSCSSPSSSEWAILLIPSTFPRPSRSMHKATSPASVITTFHAPPKAAAASTKGAIRLPHQAWIKAHRKLQASSAKAASCIHLWTGAMLFLLSLWIFIFIFILAATNGHSHAYNGTIHGRSGEHGNSQHASDLLALHGLGLVLRKGSRSMENLIIANMEETCGLLEFRLFLRTLFRSGAMANADLVLLFPWPSTAIAEPFRRIACEEDRSFHRFMRSLADSSTTRSSDDGPHISVFDPAAFEKMPQAVAVQASETSNPNTIIKKVNGHGTPSPSPSSSSPLSPLHGDQSHRDGRRSTLWGNHHRMASSSSQDKDLSSAAICTQSSSSTHRDHGEDGFEFGSVIGFQIDELDSVDGFAGFFAHPRAPRLRRWLCYQMLLGLLRTKFAQVLLVELGGVIILSDVFQHPKRRREFLHLTTRDSTWEEATSLQPAARGSGKSPEISVQGSPETAHYYNDEMPRKIHHHGVKEMYELNKPPSSMKLAGKETMFEIFYGKELWKSLDKSEKEQRMVSSRVILGSMRATKSLVNSMVLEIVRTSSSSSSKKEVSALGFDDEVLLSYLVQKCPHSLGKAVAENLAIFSNGNSISHCLDGSKQEHLFHRSSDQLKYSILQASSLNVSQYQGSHLDIAQLLMYDICSSSISSSAYDDCWKYR